jgi:hypothetical protein
VAFGARSRLRPRPYGWIVLPLLGAVLGVVARDLALAGALPAFVATSVVATALATEKGAAVERAAVLGVLGLALSRRWTPAVLGPPASDTAGYFEAARTFWGRVAELGTNPIALAYLNMHPAAREPLFPLLLSGVFSVFGAAVLYQRYVTIALAVAGVYVTYRYGKACFGVVPGLLAALVLAVLPWQVLVSQEGLREELALACVYGLAVLVVTRPWPLERTGSGGDAGRGVSWQVAVAGGLLAAGGVLTRLDAGAVVVALLVAWGLRLGREWRATLPAGIVAGVLVTPLLFGYVLRAGDPLTPLRGSMGGDIQAAVSPLTRRELPVAYLLRALGLGTWEVYAGTIFGSAAGLLPGPVRSGAVAVALAATAGGLVALVARGPRLPALLVVLGVFLPPFTFLAGTSLLHGPGGGYTERYTYLILPATLAVCAWALVGASRWVWEAADRRRGATRRLVGPGRGRMLARATR